MFRRRLAVIAAFIMVLGLLPASLSADTGFDDVPDDHVFAEDIVWLADEGITLGCNPPENSNFCPDDAVTRGQMAAFLTRALDLTESGPTFDDTVGHVFEEDISKLAAAGITLGCNPPENTNFCPDDDVTRGAMAAFLVRGLDLTESGPTFDDTAGHVFEEDISKLAAAEITLGCNPPENTNFCPDDVVTRGAMAAFLHRALDVEETPDGEFAPFTISGGAGQSEHEFRIPNDYWAVVDVTYTDGDHPTPNIIIWSLDEDSVSIDLLVNEIGDYEGRRQVNTRGDNWDAVRRLSVDAGGPWEITARPLSAAERFSGSLTGSGDDVVVYTGTGDTVDWEFDSPSPDNFIIEGYTPYAIFNQYIVNEFPGESGSASFDSESIVWDITGFSGDWTLDTR